MLNDIDSAYFWVSSDGKVFEVGLGITHCEFVVNNPVLFGYSSIEELMKSVGYSGGMSVDELMLQGDVVISAAIVKGWVRVSYSSARPIPQIMMFAKQSLDTDRLLKITANYLCDKFDFKADTVVAIEYYSLDGKWKHTAGSTIEELCSVSRSN